MQPIIAFDCFLFLYVILRLVTIGLLLGCCANICALLYTGHIGECNKTLEKMQDSKSAKFKGHQLNWTVTSTRLATFLREHTRIVTIVLTVNRELWANVVLFSLALHLPVNVYLVYRLNVGVLRGISISAKPEVDNVLFSCALLLIQLTILAVDLLPLARASEALHDAATVLPLIQHQIPAPLLYSKLKCSELYERIHCDTHKYGITVGPTRKTITYQMLAEIGLFYVAFLFKMLDFFR